MTYIISTALLMISVFAFGQTEKGTVRLGGDTSFLFANTQYDGSYYSLKSVDFAASGDYFFLNRFASGLEFGFTWNKYGEGAASCRINSGVNSRYYLPIPTTVFLGAGFDLVTEIYASETATGTGCRFQAGYAIFLNKHIALETVFNYRLGLSDKNNGTKYDQYGAQIGLSVYF
ncbi:MAG: porin family protein [Bacteroidales bacterium]|nr:porin family protein [Bacteroidales bacterium]